MGLRGAALVSGALGTGATRTLTTDVESYLATPFARASWVVHGSGHSTDTCNSFGGEPLSENNVTCVGACANIAKQDCSMGRDANPTLNSPADGALGFSFTKLTNPGAGSREVQRSAAPPATGPAPLTMSPDACGSQDH